MKKFSNGYNNVVCHILSFLPGDEPTNSVQNVNSIQEKTKTIDFTGVIQDLDDSNTKHLSKHNSDKNDVVPTISSVFQPICHMTSLNQTCLVSYSTSENLNVCFSNNDCCLTNDNLGLNQNEWYNEIDINSIDLVGYYGTLSIQDEAYIEVEVFDLPEATVQHNNYEPLFKLERIHINFECMISLMYKRIAVPNAQ